MNILEKEIEDLVQEYINTEKENVFNLDKGILLRQFELGNYGVVDLLHINYLAFNNPDEREKHLTITPIEIKRGKISYNEVGQICRYVKGIGSFISKKGYHDVFNSISVRGILMGKEIDLSSDFVYAMELIESISVYTFSLNLKTGLQFTKEDFGYTRTDEGFERIKNKQLKTVFRKLININNGYLQTDKN